MSFASRSDRPLSDEDDDVELSDSDHFSSSSSRRPVVAVIGFGTLASLTAKRRERSQIVRTKLPRTFLHILLRLIIRRTRRRFTRRTHKTKEARHFLSFSRNFFSLILNFSLPNTTQHAHAERNPYVYERKQKRECICKSVLNTKSPTALAASCTISS